MVRVEWHKARFYQLIPGRVCLLKHRLFYPLQEHRLSASATSGHWNITNSCRIASYDTSSRQIKKGKGRKRSRGPQSKKSAPKATERYTAASLTERHHVSK